MDKKKMIHLITAFVLFMGIRLILPVDTDLGLTKAGANTLAIFVAIIYCWLTVGVDWISFLAIGLLTLTKIAPSNTIWSLSWGSSMVLLVISVSILSIAIGKTGIAQKFTMWFITRKIVEGKPFIFLVFFGIANLLVGYIMNSTPTTIIFALIAKSVLDELGYTKDDKFSKAMFIIVFWVTNFGYFATPMSHTIPLLVLGLIEGTIGSVSYLKYMLVGIPFSIVLFILTMLLIKFIIRPDYTKFEKFDIQAKRAEMQPISKEGKIISVTYLLVIFFWIAPDVFKNILPEFANYIKMVGNVVPPLIAAVLICVIQVNKKPMMDFGEAMKSVPWGVISFVAAIAVFSSVISLPEGGINVFLTNIISPLTTRFSSFTLVAVALLCALLMTNFMSNGVSATIVFSAFTPAIIAMADPSISLLAYGVMLAFFVNIAFMTPAANAVAPLIFQYGYLTTADAMKYGVIIMILAYITGMGIIWPLANFIF